MYLSKCLHVCLCFCLIQGAVANSSGAQEKSSNILSKLIRLLSDNESESLFSNDKQTPSYKANVQNNISLLQPKSLEQKSASRSKEGISTEDLVPESLEESSMERQPMSPVVRTLLKRMMLSVDNEATSTNMASFGAKMSRALRADHIIGMNSRDNSLPWDKECSGGYDHCGGYFTLCCDGFVCLKPLTPWDKKHGFKRCWPDYFQEFEDSDENTR